MLKNNKQFQTMKEIETDLFRVLQETYSDLFQQLLTELDQQLAEERDKAHFQIKDKRAMTNRLEEPVESKPPKHYLEKLKSSVGEAVRDNVPYLQQATGKPIYRALKGLQGF